MDRKNPPQLRDQFRRELRARLMQQAPIYLLPRRDNAWTSLLRSGFLRPAMAVSLSAVVLIAGAGTAAAGSVPGDPAFGLKKAFEGLQVTLTFDDVKRVELLGQIADRRLDELQKVAERDDRSPTASQEFADAVTKFRVAVDAVQAAAPEDKSTAVQNLVDAARDKHEAVLDSVQTKVSNEQAKDAIERAKDAENKDTEGEKKDKDKGKTKTPRPSRSPEPSRSPSPQPSRTPEAEESPRVSGTPRATERNETPRPTTPRPTATTRPSASDSR
jgi:uncharacterized protein DUF5667